MSQKFYKSKTHILSAGNKDVLSTKENATSFIDISLYQNDKSLPIDVIQIESGDCSMIALTKQGHVYGRGRNLFGELGLGDTKPREKWTPIPIPFQVKQISCKYQHSLFLTENGQVYACGSNQLGQLGIGKYDSQCVVKRILTNKKAIKVVTGMYSFSFVLCESTNGGSCKNNELCLGKSKTILFAFGWNGFGNLVSQIYLIIVQGINKKHQFGYAPIQIKFFDDKAPIRDVQAGFSHSIVLLVDGSMYAMGREDCCGQASSKNHFYSPVLVSIENAIQSICCSGVCTIVQNVNGEWYAFGAEKIQPTLAYDNTISLISTHIGDVMPKGIQVKKLVATRNAFFLLDNKNDLYVVGKGLTGEMGMNNRNDIKKWTLCQTNITDVQTGFCNTFLFIPNPFLIYEPQMKFMDVSICFQ